MNTLSKFSAFQTLLAVLLLALVVPFLVRAQVICEEVSYLVGTPGNYRFESALDCSPTDTFLGGGGGSGGGGVYRPPPSDIEPIEDVAPTTGFPNIFLVDNNTDHSAVYDIVVRPTNHLGAGASAQIGMTYDFPYEGEWHIRACADFDGNWQGIIAESNENNNCTDWQQITVESTWAPDIQASATTLIPAVGTLGGVLQGVITNHGNAATNN